MHWLSTAQLAALLGFAGLNLLDVASTALALQEGLPEGNYLPSLLQDAAGDAAMYLFKIMTTLLVVVIVIRLGRWYPRLWYAIYVANAILVAAVLLNLTQVLAG